MPHRRLAHQRGRPTAAGGPLCVGSRGHRRPGRHAAGCGRPWPTLALALVLLPRGVGAVQLLPQQRGALAACSSSSATGLRGGAGGASPADVRRPMLLPRQGRALPAGLGVRGGAGGSARVPLPLLLLLLLLRWRGAPAIRPAGALRAAVTLRRRPARRGLPPPTCLPLALLLLPLLLRGVRLLCLAARPLLLAAPGAVLLLLLLRGAALVRRRGGRRARGVRQERRPSAAADALSPSPPSPTALHAPRSRPAALLCLWPLHERPARPRRPRPALLLRLPLGVRAARGPGLPPAR
jgi:hypothetical protein